VGALRNQPINKEIQMFERNAKRVLKKWFKFSLNVFFFFCPEKFKKPARQKLIEITTDRKERK
jgi:hypothetical protein